MRWFLGYFVSWFSVNFLAKLILTIIESAWYVAWRSLFFWMVMCLNPIRASVRAWKVGDQNQWKEQYLKLKSWYNFLCSESNHASNLQSQDHMLQCSPYNVPMSQSLSKFKSTLICWCPISNTILELAVPASAYHNDLKHCWWGTVTIFLVEKEADFEFRVSKMQFSSVMWQYSV